MLEKGRGWNGELYLQLLLSGKSNAMTTMRAVRVSSFGGPEVLKLLADVPVPSVSNGQVSFCTNSTLCSELSVTARYAIVNQSEFMFLC